MNVNEANSKSSKELKHIECKEVVKPFVCQHIHQTALQLVRGNTRLLSSAEWCKDKSQGAAKIHIKSEESG